MLKIFAIILIAALGSSGIIACTPTKASDSRRAELHLQLGTAYLAKGNYPAAMHELRVAEKLDSRNPTIHNNLGLAYFVRQTYPEAERHLQTALALNPRYTDARNNLGRLYIEMNLFDKAIANLEIANKDLTYPYPDKTLTNLGIAYFKKGDYKTARTHLKKSLGIKRHNCLTYHYYGRCLYELNDYSLAAQSFDQAISLCKGSNFDEPHYYGALSYFKMGDNPRAIARLEELLAQFPDGKYIGQTKSMLKMIK
ncbi:MAG: tetratricopeptide repeat protein [Bdellovibrionaceae bacterium]|nr:tetratricopeptide repeat protein [Bdellovibrionales bacterium]MCB9085342.1 tetratricopeptide repeat protein [Pseudobdellovibrionaceae bacterium]